ncbi:RNA polymerase sigma-70 factor (ECF subfamily) [Pedobacter sp. AK017]|uniref:RNA polymerase sigma-70 factor n=1 Tax=Pedobacter sp. AK017 TaxID=2723073 RepID=UPI00160FDF0B|nr:RNA polymerase sigma-70 factor [Pedobacter sp. AK017]MBB5437730.1 RNA polymerase sigma-70 factor (ECF subfamily) [Pedobacter sp. AK017]
MGRAGSYGTLYDAQLVTLLKEGNHYAFTEIYHRYWAKLYIYARKLVDGNHDLATDITQDVLTYVWEKRLSIQITESLSGYLHTAIKRKMLMYIRQQKTHDKFLNFLQYFISEGENITDNYMLEKELLTKIDNIINSLPPKVKEVFILSRYQNLSRKLIADKLQLSDESVKYQINSALKIFKRKLK